MRPSRQPRMVTSAVEKAKASFSGGVAWSPRFIVTFGIRVGFKGVFDQGVAVKTTALLAGVEFDAEAMSVGTLETIVFKVGHGGCGLWVAG